MTSTYFGYIMRVNGECKKKSDVKRGCVVFKAKGTLSCKCFSYMYFQMQCIHHHHHHHLSYQCLGGTQGFGDSTSLALVDSRLGLYSSAVIKTF